MTDDELKRLIESSGAGLRLHFDATADRLATESRHMFQATAEELRHEIQQVAEGVAATRESQRSESQEIRRDLERGFADTQAMIKFSHAELDRRVRALEDGQRSVEEALADMQARLERLEGAMQ